MRVAPALVSRRWVVALLLVVGQVAWGAPPKPRSGTRTFLSTYARLASGHATHPDGKPILPDASRQRYSFVFVRGLLGNSFAPITRGGYFDRTIEALKRDGYRARLASVNTAAPIAANVGSLRETILDEAHQGRQVVLIGHSNGSALIGQTLAENKDLLGKVAGHISFEGTHKGSPLADLIAGNALTRRLVRLAAPFVRGANPAVVTDMSTATRTAASARAPYPAEVPTVTILATAHGRSPLRPVSWLIAKLSPGRNDGMVTVDAQKLPGATEVELEGDHMLGAVERIPILGLRVNSRFDNAKLTKAALSLLFGGDRR